MGGDGDDSGNSQYRQEEKTPSLKKAVITGIIGILGIGIGSLLQSCANLRLEREKFEATKQLERQKFESALILKAIETGDPDRASKNLVFLLNIGLIQDSSGRISALMKKPEDAPFLPTSGTGPLATTGARMDMLQPIVASLARQLLNLARQQEIDLVIYRGFISNQEQQKYYERGETKLRPGSSPHNAGLAFDVVVMKKGVPDWKEEDALRRVAEIGKSLGLTWGGDAKQFRDPHHFEYRLPSDSR